MENRTCSGINQGGQRCLARPLRGEKFCFWHHPDYADEADQARKLGGTRRRRESTLQGAYELEGLAHGAGHPPPAGDRRPGRPRLGENSIARVRALISASLAAARLLEVGEMEERLAAVEAALGPRIVKPRGR